MSELHESPAIMQPNDPELNEKVSSNLGTDYEVGEGKVINSNGKNINENFNKGVELGPWIAPGDGQGYGYARGLDGVEADGLSEDYEKARRIAVNSYPVGPIGESKVVHDALENRVHAAHARHQA